MQICLASGSMARSLRSSWMKSASVDAVARQRVRELDTDTRVARIRRDAVVDHAKAMLGDQFVQMRAQPGVVHQRQRRALGADRRAPGIAPLQRAAQRRQRRRALLHAARLQIGVHGRAGGLLLRALAQFPIVGIDRQRGIGEPQPQGLVVRRQPQRDPVQLAGPRRIARERRGTRIGDDLIKAAVRPIASGLDSLAQPAGLIAIAAGQERKLRAAHGRLIGRVRRTGDDAPRHRAVECPQLTVTGL